MKKFTKDEIEGARTYFKNQGFQEMDVSLGSWKFSYFVVPQSLEPNLNNFVLRLTGESNEGYVLGISDSVEERFRQYAVAHEFIEFTEIGIDSPNRCVRALEEELNLVPKDIKPAYVKMRRDFFRDLISYCSEQPQFYTPNDLAQFKNNLERLEELVK
ncbi:hypothetical protein COV13_01665 [Candidatus Woesearchaeota archaeon CG10_big_fil_rev_8_21_14_0_10_32_9]|nr:MAG: hypothetical protein COV13_01665 [Candidatus Woesearchaeota archaeon CG10_big_fil_rev_8_21_14_0_10_32_9]